MKKIIAISAAAVCMMMGLASCNKTEYQKNADQAKEQIDQKADALKEQIDEKADQAKEVVDEAADKADSLQAAQTAKEAEQAVK